MVTIRTAFIWGFSLMTAILLADPVSKPDGWMTRQMVALSKALAHAESEFGQDSPLIVDKIVEFADTALEYRPASQ